MSESVKEPVPPRVTLEFTTLVGATGATGSALRDCKHIMVLLSKELLSTRYTTKRPLTKTSFRGVQMGESVNNKPASPIFPVWACQQQNMCARAEASNC